MTAWMNKLGRLQQIILALFFGVLGCALVVIPFYFETKDLVDGKEAEWPAVYYIFIISGLICVAISLRISRIDKLFNMATDFISKKKS